MDAAAGARLRSVALLLAANTLFFWQIRNPFLRFDWPLLNSIVGLALGIALPWSTAIAFLRVVRNWKAKIAVITIIPVMLLYSVIWLFVATLSLGSLRAGHDLSFGPISQTQWQGSEIRVYQTNDGALTDFGILLRQERTLLPGLRLVRTIDNLYPCGAVQVTPSESGVSVTDPMKACGPLVGGKREYVLKRFLYL